jgi:hypothetical protein
MSIFVHRASAYKESRAGAAAAAMGKHRTMINCPNDWFCMHLGWRPGYMLEMRRQRSPMYPHVPTYVRNDINRSLRKWLLGCAISLYAFTPFLFLCVSSLFNSFHPNFYCTFSLQPSRVQPLSPLNFQLALPWSLGSQPEPKRLVVQHVFLSYITVESSC